HFGERAEDALEMGDYGRLRRVEHEHPAVSRPDAVMQAAPLAVAVRVPYQPVAVRLVDAALRHDAERCRPEAGREASLVHGGRDAGEAARKLFVGLEPVAARALVAGVELPQ